MKLHLLILDDDLQSIQAPLMQALAPLLAKGEIMPQINPGFDGKVKLIERIGAVPVELVIRCNTILDCRPFEEHELPKLLTEMPDLVLIDDQWSDEERGGQEIILPALIDRLNETCSGDLPTVALFTRHWQEEARAEAYAAELLEKPYWKSNRLITGLFKDDVSGLRILIQSTLKQKLLLCELEGVRASSAKLRRRYMGISDNAELPEKLDIGFDFIGKSEAIREVFYAIQKAANSDGPVLITGEMGVGKELVASATHLLSDRKKYGYKAINAAGLEEQLISAELFGSKAGAFTGAINRAGFLEDMKDGVLFLDEIGDLKLDPQLKLLRVLNNGEFFRLGDTKPQKTNVRIIAATNRNFEEMVEQGRIRADFRSRLNVHKIHVPPLRDRIEDIPILAAYFLEKKTGKKIRLPMDVIRLLSSYQWPENVRELEIWAVRMKGEDLSKIDPSMAARHMNCFRDSNYGTSSQHNSFIVPGGLNARRAGIAVNGILSPAEEAAKLHPGKKVTLKMVGDISDTKGQNISGKISDYYKELAALLDANPTCWPLSRSYVVEWASHAASRQRSKSRAGTQVS